ncbi:unnamed protein product [Urochloa decumbens]|uniref:Uncharacterized protein n=1 Tax=Urochloa decumbens TaxID=240449 RepID=A0ABC9F0E1_9POAL
MGAKISSLFSDLRASASPEPSNALALVLLTYVAGVMIGVLAESKDTMAGWNTAKKAAYWATAVLTMALLGAGLMAATAERFRNTDVSSFCAKLGTILASALLVIAISCKFKPWGGVAGVPAAAAVACVMAVVWVWTEPAAREAIRGCWSRIWKTS